ncbi:MAG: hypothetical protein Unbinned6046contig1000_33 [Prokaryotic dsDNA virus sp.]|nr:MAG: hypothetical protein Unbinned6046contig1000_33 [Prokaryotic dsDNA virus sp.]
MANNVLIQATTIRELSVGELGPFTFKAAQGKIFSGPPNIWIYGNEWDGNAEDILVVDDTATDHAMTDRSGNGIYGTQTFKVSLKYDIGDIECGDQPNNIATIDFPTTTIGENCIDVTSNIVFSYFNTGGDFPIFSPFVYPREIPQNEYIGDSGGSYGVAALSTQTYTFYVAQETNACTFYTSTLINGGAAFGISAQYSKTVSVTTNVYTGSIDIYWGTITLVVNGDFVSASMIFDNGLRGTENWITWNDKCDFSAGRRRTGVSTGIHTLVKTNNCEFIGGKRTPIYSATTNSQSSSYVIMQSATNGYGWGAVNQARAADWNSNSAEIIEPYGRNYDEGGSGTIITVYANGIVRRSIDRGETYQSTTFPNTWSTGTFQTRIEDVAYAGVNASGNKVWYCIGMYLQTVSSIQYLNEAGFFISEDDGQTWSFVDQYTDNAGGDDLQRTVEYYGTTGSFHRQFRIHANLDKNYVFIEVTGMKHSDTSFTQQVLFKYHPSQTGSSNPQAKVAPVAEFVSVGSTPVSWDYADTFQVNNNVPGGGSNGVNNMRDPGVMFAVNDASGVCIWMQGTMYMMSWNWGLNWTEDKDMMTNIGTTKVHPTTGLTLLYPERAPDVVFYDGQLLALTSQKYGETSSTSFRNYSVVNDVNDRLIDGMMRIVVKQNDLVTGEVLDDFTTYTTYGQVPSVTSTDFGPYNQVYGSGAPISFGNGRGYIYMGYQTDLDPSYVNVYFMVYDFANDTVLNNGDLNSFAGGIMPDIRGVHGNTVYFSPNSNGPTITTRNVLYKTTDNFATASVVFTGPKTNSYSTTLCEYDGSSNNFIVTQTSSGYVNPGDALYYSTDGSTFTAVANLSNIGDGTSWNTATISKNCFIGSNCVMENGYIYFLDDTRQSTYGTLGRSFVIPVSEIADASTWVNYEITSALKNNNGSYNGVTRIVAIDDKAIIKYGSNEWQYTTNQGTSWTDLTSITDTSGNVWSTSDLNSFYAQKNHNAGQFILAYQSAYNKANTILGTWWQILWTTDFSTWEFAEWYQQDPNGDNNSSTPNLGGWTGDGTNGDIIATFRQSNSYTQKLRKVVVSDSQATANPAISSFIDTWEVIQDYEYVPAANTSATTIQNGAYTDCLYIDKNTDSGVPMLMTNHINSVTCYPEPLTPNVANGPIGEIIAPTYTGSTAFTYAPATQQYKYRASSEQPFSIVYTKSNGALMQYDGVFDILVYSLSEPVLIEGFVNQDIDVSINELINRFPTQPNNADPNFAAYVYFNREIVCYEHWNITATGSQNGVTWSPTADIGYIPTASAINTTQMRHTFNREDVALLSSAGELFNDQKTYTNDFAIEVPTGYDMDNQGIGFPLTYSYGQYLLCFPPSDNRKLDLIGLKWYADLNGTQYADGYYWYENLTDYSFGGFITGYASMTHPWANIDDNTFLRIQNGFVTEVGHAKDLPNYDRC